MLPATFPEGKHASLWLQTAIRHTPLLIETSRVAVRSFDQCAAEPTVRGRRRVITTKVPFILLNPS